jgi:hypothetical protein
MANEPPFHLSAAEVAIVRVLRERELIGPLTAFDEHAWKMLTAVTRQLAHRPTMPQPPQQQNYGGRR